MVWFQTSLFTSGPSAVLKSVCHDWHFILILKYFCLLIRSSVTLSWTVFQADFSLMLSEEYLLILCDIHIHHNLEIVKAWASCPVALKTSFSLMREYWICFFALWIRKQIPQWLIFSQDSKTQYTSYLAMRARNCSIPHLSLTQRPRIQRRVGLFYPPYTPRISSRCTVPPLAWCDKRAKRENNE